ncbi:hypothetical protein Acr_02g0006030 [Actinidia rufa]|uniref:NB-ARC domain-containing disease resistance protein n=1 Tax=Actinidia rufa TaxID=165716 RepID=A0A7J0E787_9ERIC|nr:hypothetical protein Acr_02g0006030 [Actinidia rufa]
MADAVLTFVLENLTRILSEEADLLSGVEEEVKSLESQLKLTQSYIRDFRPRRNDQTINVEFINQVRNAAHEAEDIIDEYVASLAKQRGENLMVRTKKGFLGLLARRRVAEEIKGVKRRFEELYKSRETFAIQIPQPGDMIQDNLLMHKVIYEDTDVVGLDADAAAITERLTKGAFKVRDLLQALVKRAMGLTMKDMKDMSNEELDFDLRKYLRSTPYLIVLDDVWQTEFWEQLNQVFANNLYGSRIIITTQHNDVALHVNPKSPPHNLRFLSEEESWELFSKKVLADEKCPDNLEGLGKQMADKCGGLPLAIVVLAGVLRTKEKTPRWWSKVSSSDFEISARQLVGLWIAEGFVQKKDEEPMEEVGEDYLEDLVARNMAQEEKFLVVQKYIYPLIPLLIIVSFTRLGLHSNMFNYISSNPSASKVRSMLCFGPMNNTSHRKNGNCSTRAFRCLGCWMHGMMGVEVIPGDIHKLIHLRYLMLKSLTAKTLPSSISNLWNLQTLVVTAPCIDRPQLNVWKMKELRHLHFHGQLLLPEPPKKKVKDDSGNSLSNLLTLSCLSPDSCTTSVLSMMPNLLKLGMHGDLDQHRLSRTFDNLSVLKQLQTLKLERDRRCNELDSLEYMVFPQSLVKLTIVETQLLEDPMELQVLKLVNLAIRSWTIAQGTMSSLRSVVINRCGHLEGLPSALREMPAFQELELWSPPSQVVNEAREN